MADVGSGLEVDLIYVVRTCTVLHHEISRYAYQYLKFDIVLNNFIISKIRQAILLNSNYFSSVFFLLPIDLRVNNLSKEHSTDQ